MCSASGSQCVRNRILQGVAFCSRMLCWWGWVLWVHSWGLYMLDIRLCRCGYYVLHSVQDVGGRAPYMVWYV